MKSPALRKLANALAKGEEAKRGKKQEILLNVFCPLILTKPFPSSLWDTSPTQKRDDVVGSVSWRFSTVLRRSRVSVTISPLRANLWSEGEGEKRRRRKTRHLRKWSVKLRTTIHARAFPDRPEINNPVLGRDSSCENPWKPERFGGSRD